MSAIRDAVLRAELERANGGIVPIEAEAMRAKPRALAIVVGWLVIAAAGVGYLLGRWMGD